MSRRKSIHVYVSDELARAYARLRHLPAASRSANGCAPLVVRACDNDFSLANDRTVLLKLYRQSLFATVGIDGLLAGHSDHTLRERVHYGLCRPLPRCRSLCRTW